MPANITITIGSEVKALTMDDLCVEDLLPNQNDVQRTNNLLGLVEDALDLAIARSTTIGQQLQAWKVQHIKRAD